MLRLLRFTVSFFAAAFVLLLAGCGTQPYPPQLAYPLRTDSLVAKLPTTAPDGPPAAGKLDEFISSIDDRGGKVYNPASLSPEQQVNLKKILDETFGTPANPTVLCNDAPTQSLADQLSLQPGYLAEGSRLYKRYCLQCHGLTGDGRGPTGYWVYPFPRDFRQGVFKYVSSIGTGARKPTREDFQRMLKTGIERTSMPSFSLLSDAERERIIAYTIHLSLRGEVEYRVVLGMLSDNDEGEEDLAEAARSRLRRALTQWVEADRAAIVPNTVPTPEDQDAKMLPLHQESVRRGFDLFRDRSTGCISCHENYGRQAKYLYDAWGGSVRVADLTEGVYRGGKTPLDLYHRIRGGIGPSAMPALASLPETQVWDLVHFVDALPFQKLLPPDVREQVYPQSR